MAKRSGTENTAQINIKLDKNTKEQVDDLFNTFGISPATACKMFLLQCLRESGIPFRICIPRSNNTDIVYIQRPAEKISETSVSAQPAEEKTKQSTVPPAADVEFPWDKVLEEAGSKP